MIGQTCGDLWLQGWDVCTRCGKCWLSKDCKPCAALVWTLCKGGRSVDIGNGRIRCTIKAESGERLDVQGLMARIARLPELERELAELRAKGGRQ
jgi:hypothetical protein